MPDRRPCSQRAADNVQPSPCQSGAVLRIAVVGSGPAGIYTTEALLRAGSTVDVFDRLPCPFGLVRYGVAPDHPKIRSITATLSQVMDHPAVRFLGNVEIGSAITLEELDDHYDAVVVACGAATDRRLGVPGEDLPGSVSATDFVAWYNGHPDAPPDAFSLDARSVMVIGNGNVALDVARLMCRPPADLARTDVAGHVLAAFERSAVREVHLVGRRGPAQARFTPKELRELGETVDADVVVDLAELELDEVSRRLLESSPAARRNLEVLTDWAQRPPPGRLRRLYVRFGWLPVQVQGADSVTGVRLERARLDATGTAVGTGDYQDVEAQLVVRSVGYHGVPLPGLPFDRRTGVVPNADGRVLDGGAPVPRRYVAGWIKRGPTGVIGTNRRDGTQTAACVLADAAELTTGGQRGGSDVVELLRSRGVQVVTWDSWTAIGLAEAALGQLRGRESIRIADRRSLLAAAGL